MYSLTQTIFLLQKIPNQYFLTIRSKSQQPRNIGNDRNKKVSGNIK